MTRQGAIVERWRSLHQVTEDTGAEAMNHTANIKEILNTQSGGCRNSGPNFTDSQFFFGSQFWRDNPQNFSQDMSLSSRNSQQSSQECSDPKISTRYQSKPLLFGGDPKDFFGDSKKLLDAFEEEKKKAKDKSDRDMLAKECLQIRETLTKVQQLVANTEENTSVCQTILQKLSDLSSTLQSLSSIQSDISQQFKTLLDTVNSQKEMMIELGERVQKNGDRSIELGANMKSDVECLRLEQDKSNLKQESKLEEALQLLNVLVSEHSTKHRPLDVTDKAMQTSPGRDKGVQTVQDTSDGQVSVPDCVVRKRKEKSISRYRRRPLVRQRSKLTVTDQPHTDSSKQQIVSTAPGEPPDLGRISGHEISVQSNPKSKSSKSVGCFITPLSCWSHDSSRPESPKNVNPDSEVILIESSPPDLLWHLFEID
ncbi:interactor of HORMAD1 protein 1 isoform X1 [Syngnathus typhle]|uniref:interactor of HORMAD1 protein 1 isoform X1 n=2 Tax=Syngnathus typhle TaxID=161592 RepID=UPI002A6A54F1|nr:interactor of HORMAD1 protein 1 isoform X1 [Syngnathus typhle]